MRGAILAALTAVLCHVSFAAAEDRPSHDPAIERAAIAILQKKLPEMRGAYDISSQPVIVRGAEGETKPKGISALVDPDARPAMTGQLIWL